MTTTDEQLNIVYGDGILRIKHQENISDEKIHEAYSLAVAQRDYTFPYFYGILKRLP